MTLHARYTEYFQSNTLFVGLQINGPLWPSHAARPPVQRFCLLFSTTLCVLWHSNFLVWKAGALTHLFLSRNWNHSFQTSTLSYCNCLCSHAMCVCVCASSWCICVSVCHCFHLLRVCARTLVYFCLCASLPLFLSRSDSLLFTMHLCLGLMYLCANMCVCVCVCVPLCA